MTYDLRPSTEADHDAIADIWHASAGLPGVGPDVMPTRQEMRSRIDVEVASGWRVTVAARDHEVIGFVAIRHHDAVVAELFVRPDVIGGGVGRALLAHAMVALPQGFSLYTRSSNTRARRFYETSGLAYLRDDTHPRTGDPIVHYGWKTGAGS